MWLSPTVLCSPLLILCRRCESLTLTKLTMTRLLRLWTCTRCVTLMVVLRPAPNVAALTLLFPAVCVEPTLTEASVLAGLTMTELLEGRCMAWLKVPLTRDLTRKWEKSGIPLRQSPSPCRPVGTIRRTNLCVLRRILLPLIRTLLTLGCRQLCSVWTTSCDLRQTRNGVGPDSVVLVTDP